MQIRKMMGAALVTAMATACATANDPFTALDIDDDARLDMVEYTAAARDAGYFVVWDVDDDGLLNEVELRDGYMEAGVQMGYWADVWDLNEDGLLAEEELYEGNFHELDENDDDFIDPSEFEVIITT